ncbi:MAG: DUF294 nucleotidyltransferase-like domain-containing protein [Spongiibacteraceae bacterium]
MLAAGVQPELKVVTEFLARCLPFDSLSESDFNAAAHQLEVVYYRRGHVFDRQTPETGLRILRSGAVEIRDENKLLDRLGEGESFNLASLSKNRIATRAVLIEDALIYFLPEKSYQHLRTINREFDRFFHSQKDRRLRRAVRYDASPHQMMTAVSTLMSKDVLVLSGQDTLSIAAQRMTDRRVSSALIVEQGRLSGIVTDRDFRSRAMAQGMSLSTRITKVMTPNPLTIDLGATLFDATLMMTLEGYHHLPVMDQGEVIGIITASDLMLAKQDDPVYMVQHISRQHDVAGLKSIAETLPTMLVEWADAGVPAAQISRILTAISDAVTARLIELYTEENGTAPVAFCWLGFGSQGRSEQLIGADQDNGLLISDEFMPEHDLWFKGLATFVCDGLDLCGYVYCSGKIMATTDQWRQSLSCWKQTVERWTRSPTPKAVMHVSIFFDLRSVYGDTSLCQQLQQHMLACSSKNSIFLAALAENVLAHTPPLGIFRRFLVERNGDYKDTLNLKKRGILPIIDMVRIHSLANCVAAVNTHERIAELMRIKKLTISDGRNMDDALDYIMRLRVNEQVRQLTTGEPISHYFNPDHLPELGRKHLRDVFTVVHEAQEVLRINYRGGI